MRRRAGSVCTGAVAMVLGATVALCGCSKSGTRVRAQIWRSERSGAPPQLLDRSAQAFVAPSPGRSVIALTPGIYASAAGGTQLTIRDLRMEEDGNETSPGAMTLREADLQLQAGELCVYLAPDETGGHSQISIIASNATISGEAGALFLVRVTAEELRVTSARGTLQIDAGGARRLVKPGDYLLRRDTPGQAATSAGAVGEDASAQDDLDAALEEDSKIRELVREHAAAPPPWLRR